MLIGLLSDSHDDAGACARVAAFFRERRVETAFHLGDVCEPETLDPFGGLPLVVVKGNNDDASWPDSWQQQMAGLQVGATHGHMHGELARLTAGCDVVLHGHTHARRAERVGRALVINPGALYRTSTKTCALLELPSKRVVFYRVDEDRVARL